jgi:hypothetical protein
VEGFIDFAAEVLSLGFFTDVHVEFSDLVGIHAWSGNLNRTSPVEVEVA